MVPSNFLDNPGSIAACEPVSTSISYDESLSVFEEVLRRAEKIEEREASAKDESEKGHQRKRLKQLVSDYSVKLVETVSTSGDQNFLHFLASSQARITSSSVGLTVQKLAARMLLQPGGVDLLLAADDLGNTPLHTAIQHNNRNFLLAISGRPSQPETVEKVRQSIERGKDTWALRPTGTTFLHDALASKGLLHDNRLLLAIIALAPDAMLCAQDIKGRTPLHMAVEYSKCTALRLEIVRELISRDSSVLLKRDNRSLSVYQYHVLSKPGSHNNLEVTDRSRLLSSSLEGRAVEPGSPAPSLASSMTRGTPNVTDETAKRIKDELILESMRVMSCDVAHRCLNLPNKNDKELWFDYMPAPSTDMTFAEFKSHWDMLDFEMVLKYVSIANIKFKLDKGFDRVVRQSRDDAKHILLWLLKEKNVDRILHVIVDDISPNYHSNESIEQALEMANVEILDWRRPDLCPSTIFKIGINLRELHLHWGGNNAILRAWSEAEGLPMLAQYGKLKLIVIVWPKDSPDTSSHTSKQKISFDERLKRNWLLVAEMSISESEKVAIPYRSPQESAVGRLLRHRNGKASPDETGTLASQPLNLDPEQLPHSPPRSSQVSGERERAKNRLNLPEIHHNTVKASVKPKLGDNSGHAGEMDQHRWMQCMEDFTTVFLRVRQPSTQDIDANHSLKPVLIALIDDGVDTTNRSLQGKTYHGRSFAFDDVGGRNYPYWMSDSNHGTIMARFIRKLCPTADIYIIKVATRRGTRHSSRLTIDIPSAIEAINHAVDRGARIISISWSVKPPAKGELRDKFDRAVQRAVKDNIIMLCASSDQGETGNDENYPYDANRANIIRIGAATAMGSNAEYVNTHHVDFLFPGHEILLKGSTLDKELGNVHKGSSVATAIAAGLAAMVLECVRIGHFWTSKFDKPRSMEPITDQDLVMDSKSIKSAFEGMSRSHSRYIWVWQTFTPCICEKITDGGRDDQWEVVTKLAHRFLNKGQ